jgi:hypothetical protein
MLYKNDVINFLPTLSIKSAGWKPTATFGQHSTMSAVTFFIIITAIVVVVGLVCYTLMQSKQLATLTTKMDALCENDDDDDDSDGSDDDFQDLRHHRLYREPPYTPQPAVAAPPYPPYSYSAPQPKAAAPAPEKQTCDAHMVQYQMPKPPATEEYNDIRVFYPTTLPVVLDNLNIENCVECELLDAVIPRGDYVIHSRNQTFQVRQPFEASVQTFTDITIPVGDYSATTLASAITSLVTAAGLTGFSCSYVALTKNFRLQDDSVADLSFNSELAYDLGLGSSLQLALGSVQFPISTTGTYDITVTNNTFEISVNGGSYTTYTIALGTYTAATLGTAVNTALSSPLTAAYLNDGAPSLVFYHSTGAALDVRLSQGLMALLALTSNTGSTLYDSGSGVYYATSSRADLFGSRYVEIKTAELNAPNLHSRGVLQAAFIGSEITNWRADGSDTLRRRRFPAPISLRRLTISFTERHPSKSDETDFYDMELNGLAVSLRICFRRLRYKNTAQDAHLGTH